MSTTAERRERPAPSRAWAVGGLVFAASLVLLRPTTATAQQRTDASGKGTPTTAKPDSAQPRLTNEQACAKMQMVDSLRKVLIKSSAMSVDTVKDTTSSSKRIPGGRRLNTVESVVKSDSATLAVLRQIDENVKAAMPDSGGTLTCSN